MQNTENKFKHDGLWYIAVEESSCRNCDFMRDDGGCSAEQKRIPMCDSEQRQDNRNVIFVESDVDNLGDEE